jgi:uridine kinase
MGLETDLARAVRLVTARRRALAPPRAVLVAVSGIDASGKGWVAARLAEGLQRAGLQPAVVGVDPWLRLPPERFAAADPGPHFYRRAIRFEALFQQLVLPLREHGRVHVEADAVHETSTAYDRRRYAFEDVDVVLLEGVFLLQRDLRRHYDVTLWVECGFATALRRALARRQEDLPEAETIAAYRSIYFPAQRAHLDADAPRAAADLVLRNETGLGEPGRVAGP